MKKSASKNVRIRMSDMARRFANDVPVHGVTGHRKTYVEARDSARSLGHMAGDKISRITGAQLKTYIEFGKEMKPEAREFLDLASKTPHLPKPKPQTVAKPLATLARVIPFVKKGSVGPLMPAFLDELEKIARVVTCPECHKLHVPKCDKCGSTRDLRSYHGPCGKCAFGKKKTAGPVSWTAGKLRGAGQVIASVPKKIPGALQNVGRAAGELTDPVGALKRGWKWSLSPEGGMLHPLNLGLMGMGVAQGISDVRQKEDPTGMGRSRLRRGLRFAGGQVGGLMTAPYGFWGGVAGMSAGEKAGDVAGLVLERLRGVLKRPQHSAALPPPPQGNEGRP